MLIMAEFNKKAFDILRNYRPDNPEKTSLEEFEYAKKAGLMYDVKNMSHDEIISWAILEFECCNKKSITDSFIFGLDNNLPFLRSTLSAYAVMTNFPRHIFEGYSDELINPHCKICALYENQRVDLSFINRCRWNGAIIWRRPDMLAFYLQQHNKEPTHVYEILNVKLFINILDEIASSLENETPSSLSKRLRKLKLVKMSVDEMKYFIDTLGYCGILQTNEHVGFIYKFTSHINPRKSRSSDWGYPVDFWIGSNGINIDALSYWFGDYPEVANWIDNY